MVAKNHRFVLSTSVYIFFSLAYAMQMYFQISAGVVRVFYSPADVAERTDISVSVCRRDSLMPIAALGICSMPCVYTGNCIHKSAPIRQDPILVR